MSSGRAPPTRARARRPGAPDRRALTRRGEVALGDAGALPNPLVVRVEHATEVAIRVRATGEVVPATDDGKAGHFENLGAGAPYYSRAPLTSRCARSRSGQADPATRETQEPPVPPAPGDEPSRCELLPHPGLRMKRTRAKTAF